MILEELFKLSLQYNRGNASGQLFTEYSLRLFWDVFAFEE